MATQHIRELVSLIRNNRREDRFWEIIYAYQEETMADHAALWDSRIDVDELRPGGIVPTCLLS